MYAEFYGLDRLAFQLTPDPHFFFESSQHRRAMAYLTYGLHNAEGFIVISGEVGAGKTTLVDCLLSQIDPRSFVAAKIVTSQLSGDDLLRMVVSAFGLDHSGLPKAGLLHCIQEYVLAQFAANRRALLIIDEAQNLSFAALEELRMLSNIIVGSKPALQSFLLGQPQFRSIIGHPALDQLRQRVTASYHLGPLDIADTRSYIEHRLRCAGWKGDPELQDECFGAIFRHTGGVPRRINALCSRILLFGMIENSHSISQGTVEQVASELDSEIANVALPGDLPVAKLAARNGAIDSVYERLDSLDSITASHDHAIRRMIEIMSKYGSKAVG